MDKLPRFLRCTVAAALSFAVFSLTACNIITINNPNGLDSVTENINIPPSSDTADTEPEITEETAENNINHVISHADKYTNEKLASRYLSSIQRKTFDGTPFFITTTNLELLMPPAADSEMNIKRLQRNQTVEDKFDISFIMSKSDISTILTEAINAYNSDSYYTDLLAIPINSVGMFAAQGILMNLNSLPYLDLSKPYFNYESISAASGGYETYAVTGEALFNPNDLYGLYFNKTLLRNTGIELPYQLVYDKKWTWDKFFEICSTVSGIDGDSPVYSYASSLTDERLIDSAYASMGEKYFISGTDRIPKIAFTENSSAKIIELIQNLIYDENRFVTDGENNPVSIFNTGKSVFLFDRLYVMEWIANSATNWGILPVPMENEYQGAYKNISADETLAFAVLGNNTSVEMVSLVMQGMMAASYGHITDVYMTEHMNNTVRDNDSLNMLEIIMNSAAYDFGTIFSSAYNEINLAGRQTIYNAVYGKAGISYSLGRYAPAAENLLNQKFAMYD